MFVRIGIPLLVILLICPAILVAISQLALAQAREVLYVAPNGLPGATGTREAPLNRIQEALDRAKPGTTVKVLPGVYRERVRFRTSGTEESPLILEGTLGAVIDGSEDFTPRWEPAPDIAEGVFRARNMPFNPITVVANGRIVASLQESRVTPPRATEEAWYWQNLLRNGVNGWQGVRALALYRNAERELLVRFYPDIDPTQLDIRLAPRQAVVEISGVDHVVVRGLALRNAWYGVHVENSTGAVIEYCEIGPTDHGVWFASGSQRGIVRYNDIAHYPYGNVSTGDLRWQNWLAHKTGGYYDRVGVEMWDTIGYHEVHDNYIHDHFDGIEDFNNEDPAISPQYNHNLRIHHNLVVNIMDDGLEPNGSEIDSEWHDNIVINAICGLRVKRPTHGPLYIYRNIFYQHTEGIRFYGEKEMTPAKVYVYNNTSVSDNAITSNKVFGIGTPNYHVYNNLFYSAGWWGNTGNSVEPNWTGDYNVYIQSKGNSAWPGKELADRLGIDTHSKWSVSKASGFIDPAGGNWALTTDSPARGAGTDLSQQFSPPLPGGNDPGYITGNAPDAGALTFGAPMPALPRQGAVRVAIDKVDLASSKALLIAETDYSPDIIDMVLLAVDDNVVYQGAEIPRDLSINMWPLASGQHQLALEVSGPNGIYGKAVARFDVVHQVRLISQPSNPVAGVITIGWETLGIPTQFVQDVRVDLRGANDRTAQIGLRTLYRGFTDPTNLALDTTELEDGVYTLCIDIDTTDGQVFSAEEQITVQNWQHLVDYIKPPLDTGWLGVFDNAKTSSKSAGWEYATDNAQAFFQDTDRIKRISNKAEYLTWKWSNLMKFKVLIYTTSPSLADILDIAVSADEQQWYKLIYAMITVAENAQGRRKVEISGTLPTGIKANFFRVTLLQGYVPPEDIQIGYVSLSTLVTPKQ